MFHVQAWTTEVEEQSSARFGGQHGPQSSLSWLLGKVKDSRRVEGDRQLPRASRAANDERAIRGLLLRACFSPTRLHTSLV